MRLWQIGHINELSSEHVRHFKRTGDYVVKAMAQVIERGKHGGDPSRSPCGASPGSAAFPELSLCTPCVESADERGFCITTSPSFSGGDDFSMIEDQNAEELVHRAMLLIYNNMARGAFVNVGSQRRVSKEVLLNALRLYLLPVEAFCGSKIFIHEGYTPHHGEALCVEYQLRPYVGTNILFDAYTYKSPLGQCCIGVETASVQTQRIDIFTYTNSKKARVNKDDQIEACIGKGTDIQALQQILGLLGASYVIPIRTEVGFDLLGFACLTMGTQEIRRGGLDFVYAVGREETAATRWYIGSKPPEVQNQNFTVRPSPVTSVHYANFTVV
uniref:Uncharacterized protein n=2 Tax=Pinguiococcus pyrenoidosus TaxID=172671 RepID=A0A7R9UE05_9STRA|mmetsp:Transcript_528/g.1907  ORF Transcript_528/g.1907 Transcript_528/m.1907 type:complete len:329 (+) Transcript_528:930-1916(+)